MPEKRDPLRDPKAGDVFVLSDGDTGTITHREIMPMNRVNVNGIRRGSEYVQYKLRGHPGITFYMSLSGFKKRIFEVLHAAD